MLAALGYQESRWRPAAVSPRGAQGVMMLMPLTAKKMGVNNVFSADENISGGARYLAYMKERIPQRIRDPDRTWMAMAAYNIGIGHLEDARIITQMRKKNPDRWADVRPNLIRLSDPRWHSRVKRGYANGSETVQFVERVSQFAAILEIARAGLGRGPVHSAGSLELPYEFMRPACDACTSGIPGVFRQASRRAADIPQAT